MAQKWPDMIPPTNVPAGVMPLNCAYASVWHWRREVVGGRRNGMSEAVRRSDAANDGRKRARLRLSFPARRARVKRSATGAGRGGWPDHGFVAKMAG